jgi:hypothetical protein
MARKTNPKGQLSTPNYDQDNVVDLDVYLKILKSGDGVTIKFTEEKRNIFFKTILECGNVAMACAKAGVSRRLVYNIRDKDPEFKAMWQECIEVGLDRLEQEAFRRGYTGVDKPIHFQGRRVDTVKEYSDQMLQILLKAHIPRYRAVDTIVPAAVGNFQVIDVTKVPTELLEQLQQYVTKDEK